MADNVPWINRMADNVAHALIDPLDGVVNLQDSDLVKTAMEAAAEMKNVKLKVALARCYEIMRSSDDSGNQVAVDDDFLAKILDLSN